MKRREYAAGRGTWPTGLDGTLWPMDMLSQPRGSENLRFDPRDHPDEVRAAPEELLRAWKWINGERFEMVNSLQDGMVSLGLWAPGRYVHVGCEISCMISSQDYQRFVMPELADLTRWMDHRICHLMVTARSATCRPFSISRSRTVSRGHLGRHSPGHAGPARGAPLQAYPTLAGRGSIRAPGVLPRGRPETCDSALSPE
jgi:hypothetical protein